MTPKSKYFQPKELIQPSLFDHMTEEALMRCIGHDVCNHLDMLREDYEGAVILSGKHKTKSDIQIYINGKYWGKEYKHSGLRSLNCPEGVENSKHKAGRAFDLKCKHLDILNSLIFHNHYRYHITRIEHPDYTPTWRHVEFDTYATSMIIFKPKRNSKQE